jgi:O-antigen/teichoic acid export membrane protein
MAEHPPPQPDRHETPDERADRNLIELLQELRVLQTGVQIVFAFLLGVAFTPRFAQLGDVQQDLYVGTLLLTVIAVALFATPVAIHRGLFHRGAKRRIVAVSTRLAEVGLLFLALALNGAVLLLMDVVLGWPAAIAIACATAVVFAGLWFALSRWLRRPWE